MLTVDAAAYAVHLVSLALPAKQHAVRLIQKHHAVLRQHQSYNQASAAGTVLQPGYYKLHCWLLPSLVHLPVSASDRAITVM